MSEHCAEKRTKGRKDEKDKGQKDERTKRTKGANKEEIAKHLRAKGPAYSLAQVGAQRAEAWVDRIE